MPSKILEARAIISAEDRTGAVFDKIAGKMKGLTKTAEAFDKNTRSFTHGDWGASIQREAERIGSAGKILNKVERDFARFDAYLKRAGPVRASSYFRAVDDWKSRTLTGLREVKSAQDDVGNSHKNMMKSASRFALHATGIGGGAYLASRGIHAGVGASAERAREAARFNLAGMSEEEKARANAKADEVSGKYPSIGRTEVLGHIRQLRARLGDFDHAIENVETLSKAQVVLGTLGQGGEHGAEDLEKLVLGLESQGVGSNPKKFETYLNAFVKAKSLFPDLSGDDFRQYMQKANSSKYGLSEDYLTNVAPTMMQHEGASNFGTMQASAFSALVGKRQTKAAQAQMRSFGLLDKNGGVIDEKGFIADPSKWANEKLLPALTKKNITLDEEHRGDVVKAMTQMFSNRKVGEFFASLLVNKQIIEKDRELLKHSKGTEGADQARREDPYVALSGLTNQMKDTAAAFIGMKPVIAAMNSASTALANIASTMQTGKVPENTLAGRVVASFQRTPEEISEANRRDGLERLKSETEQQIKNREAVAPKDDFALKQLRLRHFEARSGIDASKSFSERPPLFSDKEVETWQEIDRERRRGQAYSTMPTRTPADLDRAKRRVPLPAADPRKTYTEMPPVQSLEGANVQATLNGQADVRGSVDVNVKVEAGSTLIAIRQQVETLVATVSGYLRSSPAGGNGPGSTGRSSPDAAAPVRFPSGGHH